MLDEHINRVTNRFREPVYLKEYAAQVRMYHCVVNSTVNTFVAPLLPIVRSILREKGAVSEETAMTTTHLVRVLEKEWLNPAGLSVNDVLPTVAYYSLDELTRILETTGELWIDKCRKAVAIHLLLGSFMRSCEDTGIKVSTHRKKIWCTASQEEEIALVVDSKQ